MSATSPSLAEQPPHQLEGLIPYPSLDLLSWLVALLAFFIALGLLGWWLRKKKKFSAQAATPPAPLQGLLKELRQLEPPLNFTEKAGADYFFELSLVFRKILELIYDFPATDLTLQELKTPLTSKLSLPPEQGHKIVAFFERAELIKFAAASTHRQEAHTYHTCVLSWVEQMVSDHAGEKSKLVNASTASLNPPPLA